MAAFVALVEKLIPLYLVILAGYLAGRRLKTSRESIAGLLIYVIVPVVIFHGVLTAKLTTEVLLLPVVFFGLCCLICLVSLAIAKRVLGPGPRAHILAFSVGSGNTGYFGLPVAIALFGQEAVPWVLLSALGFILYENSVGFFVTARGHHTVGESFRRISRLPSIYAFGAALVLNLVFGAQLPAPIETVAQSFRGAYSVLGMMMIGLGVAASGLRFDAKFISLAFAGKFLVWPALVFGFSRFFDPAVSQVMTLMSIVPLPANTVALATELRTEPEKAATAVLASTLFALFFIPLVTSWLW